MYRLNNKVVIHRNLWLPTAVTYIELASASIVQKQREINTYNRLYTINFTSLSDDLIANTRCRHYTQNQCI